MSQRTEWIIDTNLLVHWIMSNQIMPFACKTFALGQEFAEVYRKRYHDSAACITEALKAQAEHHEFLITELSLNELFSGIRDEIRTIILFKKGVPLSHWASVRETKDVVFAEGLSRQLYEGTMAGLDSLVNAQPFKIIPTSAPSDRKEYFDVYSSLVFLNPSLRTQDAMLLITAIFSKADNFVTTDRGLIRLGRQLKDRYQLYVLTPATACQKLVQTRSGSKI